LLFLPRFNFRLCRKSVFAARQFEPRKPASGDASNRLQEPSLIVVLPLVEPEGLLIKVAEQVEGLNGNVGAFDGPLQ
jgi:hypothetical protein